MKGDRDAQVGDNLETKLESWRERLLDLGNRNPLVNCRFSQRSSLIEFDTPSSEIIWRTLAAESEACASAMRFPWRRDLVPPPEDWKEFEDEPDSSDEADSVSVDTPVSRLGASPGSQEAVAKETASGDSKPNVLFRRRKRREWNPSLESCRNSPRLTSSDLLVDLTDTALDRKLRKLAGDAKLAMSEQGVQSLYAAFGFLKWYESVDSGEQRISPLILVPVTLSRETTSAPWELTEAEDDALDNLCLRQRLWQDFKLGLPPLPEISELEEPGAREAFLDAVRSAVANNDRWTVDDRCAIGRFAFPKIAMWQDLGEHRDSVIGHAHCRILGGDESEQGGDLIGEAFGPIDHVPSSRQLDDVLSPGEVKTILDCDSSQLEAIVAARKGVSFVLDGPPGTGKSQTIANIIADALSVGRTVLFVSEKIAALEVVKKRLEDRGLGDFCLECHSSKANRRSVLFELERCLDLPAEVYQDTSQKLDELAQQRDKLNQYARQLHKPTGPLDFSPFELFGRISKLKALDVQSRTRCVIPTPIRSERSSFDRVLRLLQRANDFAELIAGYGDHPWRGCWRTTRSLSLRDDLKHHLGILSQRLDGLADLFEPLANQPAGNETLLAITIANLESNLEICRRAAATPEMPTTWLDKPDIAAARIVEQLTADAAMLSLQDNLSVLADQSGLPASIETINQFVSSTKESSDNNSIAGLTVTLPETPRQRKRELEKQVHRIGPAHDSLRSVGVVLSDWQSKRGIQTPLSITLDQLPLLGQAIVVAADVGPAREAWLDAKYQKQVGMLADKAIAIAEKNDSLAAQLSSVIAADQILPLSDELEAHQNLTDQIENVAKLGLARLTDLEQADQSLREAVDALTDLNRAQDSLWSVLNLDDPQWTAPTRSSDQLQSVLRDVERIGVITGGLKDADERVLLRKISEEAISDLGDADAIRSDLESRLSHRAFRDASEPIAARGTEFTSVWKRWFGGYKKFRLEVADLYNGQVPGDSELLDDLVMLERFHRRLADVQAAAATRSGDLPTDFDPLEAAAWQRLKDAIDASEQLQKTWPSLWNSLPNEVIAIQTGDLGPAAEIFIDRVQQLDRLSADPQLKPLHESAGTNSQRLQQLQNRQTEIANVASVWRSCDQRTARPLQSIAELPVVTKALAVYRQRAANLIGGAQRYSDWFPANAEPTDRNSWETIQSGLQAAKLFESARIPLSKLSSSWCDDRFADLQAEWKRIGSELLDAQQKCSASLTAAGIDPTGQSLSELGDAIGSTFDSWTRQLAQADAVIALLVGDNDPSITELEKLADSFAEYLLHQGRSQNAQTKLNEVGIHSLQSTDLSVAQWLVAAMASGGLTSLAKAVATDVDVRQQAQAVVEQGIPLVDRDYHSAVEFLRSLFDFDQPLAGGTSINDAPLGELAQRCKRLSEQTDSFDQWVSFAGWRKDVYEVGLGTIVDELIAERFTPDQTPDVFAMQVYRGLFDELAESQRYFGEFDVDQHERVRDRFRQLDQWEVKAAASQIRQYQLGRDDRPSSSFNGADSSELGILQKEIAKKRRHKPLRRLFAEIPTVLQRLKPCVMMSPLSVSTFLNTNDIRFDLVIFDEASQVFPWDALGAVYRGSQLIVAGDDKQLPPTNFFSRQDAESEDEEDDIGDYESILSLCKAVGMPNKRLKWHYRSKREPLIAFSNRHFYDGELVTFPSVYDGVGVHFEHVPEGRWIERKNLKEAERVVEMIVEHIKTHPDKSLGVIALNSTHQRAIEDTLYDLRRDRRDIDALFDGGDSFGTAEERLFIKNLENVQGDERDFIFLSLGYGFNNVGKFNKHFGPINKQHGERRLNVAITRAREKLVFVASVRSADMDLSGSRSEGAHLLKSYLSYAERGVDTLDLEMQEFAGETDSPFEEEVAAALIRRGLDPVSQVGCGGFRIDLALKHPDRPGQFCLAVECDGATYHSSHTARDRDRIRQSILENLGWTIVRIWSTDWVRNPQRQVDRVLEAYEASIMSGPAVERTTERSAEDDANDNDDDLDPTYIAKETDASRRQPMHFDSIDEVTDEAIDVAAAYLLNQAGAMTMDDLIKQTSRELGFRRTGQKIRSRIELRLHADLDTGKFKRSGQRIAIHSQNSMHG